MKKLGLIALVTTLLMGCFAMATMADGLEIGLGYSQLDTRSSIEYNSLEILEVDSSTPLYTLSVDYDVNDWLSLSGKYSFGSNDVITLLDAISLESETKILQLEAAMQWSVGETTKLGAIIGYLDYENTLSLLLKVKNEISGFYIGPVFTFNPNDNWEFGASYRYLFNADNDVSISLLGSGEGDASYAVAEIYAETHLSDNWLVRAAYTNTSLDWDIDGLDGLEVNRNLSGLSLMLKYQF